MRKLIAAAGVLVTLAVAAAPAQAARNTRVGAENAVFRALVNRYDIYSPSIDCYRIGRRSFDCEWLSEWFEPGGSATARYSGRRFYVRIYR